MLGIIEVHPDESDNAGPSFANAERVVGTDRLLEHLEESPRHRVESREFLRARLMDIFFGDWDRHVDQWRWARYTRGGTYWWLPVPEDRDNAFSSYDGLLVNLAQRAARNLVEFEAEYPDVYGLTENAQTLDRRLLSDLPREAFESMAAELQRRLTDEVISDAVARTPPEYYALRGAELIQKLRVRRDALPAVAQRFYTQLAREVDVRATDAPELAEIYRFPGGSVEVRLHAVQEEVPAREAYFRRRFLPGETREVRLYLHGGNDRAFVRGAARESLIVRIIGGGGDDVLVDSSRVSGRPRTAFYDARGDNQFVTRGGTVVDTREFTVPEAVESGFNENRPPFRDWGVETFWFQPHADWRSNIGPVIGGGPLFRRYGFRRVPYAHQVALRGLFAPAGSRFGVELEGDVRRTNSRSRLSLLARASQIELTRFHGFGNETPADGPADRYKVWETEYRLATLYHVGLGEEVEIFLGPTVQYTRPELEAGGPAEQIRPLGSEAFGQLGGEAGVAVDTRDLPSYPRRGVYTLLRGSAFPATWGVPSGFGSVEAALATFLPLPLPLETTLALRSGGRVAWGDYPFQEAAFIGGSGSLRGYPTQRFAGDAALFGGVELRSFVTRFNLISRGDLGLIALADAGRVFVDGESSSTWHTAFGGGIWVGILDRTRTLNLLFAHGERSILYLGLGMPF